MTRLASRFDPFPFAANPRADSRWQQSCFGRIYESDQLIPQELCEKLKSAVAKLENVPDDEKDWHPRTNEMVLDLVHPSLYCLVYGRTLAFPKGSKSQTNADLKPIEGPTMDHEEWAYSTKYAWIPTEFKIAQDGAPSKALSYINNIHPSDKDLYTVIEALVGRFSLIFNRVLTDLRVTGDHYKRRVEGGTIYPDETPDQEDGEDDDLYEERFEAWKRSNGTLPTVADEGYTGHVWSGFEPYELDGRKIQIIVKLANHHLVSGVAMSTRGLS